MYGWRWNNLSCSCFLKTSLVACFHHHNVLENTIWSAVPCLCGGSSTGPLQQRPQAISMRTSDLECLPTKSCSETLSSHDYFLILFWRVACRSFILPDSLSSAHLFLTLPTDSASLQRNGRHPLKVSLYLNHYQRITNILEGDWRKIQWECVSWFKWRYILRSWHPITKWKGDVYLAKKGDHFFICRQLTY